MISTFWHLKLFGGTFLGSKMKRSNQLATFGDSWMNELIAKWTGFTTTIWRSLTKFYRLWRNFSIDLLFNMMNFSNFWLLTLFFTSCCDWLELNWIELDQTKGFFMLDFDLDFGLWNQLSFLMKNCSESESAQLEFEAQRSIQKYV